MGGTHIGVTNIQRRPSWELTGQTQGLQSGTRCAQGGHHYLQRRGEAQCPEGCCGDRKLPEHSVTLSDKSFHSPARRHPKGCFLKSHWGR